MPANLPPQYKEAEQRYREARGRDEKLEALREMMALLPKHKGTEKLQADLRHRIAKHEEEAQHGKKTGAHRFDPGHVEREGAGQWVLLGPPNAGKSALVRALTHAHPEVASYPFTTRVPLSGMMPFEDVQVQLVDSPAVTAEHCEPYIPNLAHGADGLLLVFDVAEDDLASDLAVLLSLVERARVWPLDRPSPGDLPAFVVRRPVRVLLNKCDLDGDGIFQSLAREVLPPDLPCDVVSSEHGQGLEPLRSVLFESLERIRVYAKEPGKKPDMDRPFVLRRGATVHDFALHVHKELAERLKFARLWGHARFDGQQVDREHALADRDVVELHG